MTALQMCVCASWAGKCPPEQALLPSWCLPECDLLVIVCLQKENESPCLPGLSGFGDNPKYWILVLIVLPSCPKVSCPFSQAGLGFFPQSWAVRMDRVYHSHLSPFPFTFHVAHPLDLCMVPYPGIQPATDRNYLRTKTLFLPRMQTVCSAGQCGGHSALCCVAYSEQSGGDLVRRKRTGSNANLVHQGLAHPQTVVPAGVLAISHRCLSEPLFPCL